MCSVELPLQPFLLLLILSSHGRWVHGINCYECKSIKIKTASDPDKPDLPDEGGTPSNLGAPVAPSCPNLKNSPAVLAAVLPAVSPAVTPTLADDDNSTTATTVGIGYSPCR